MKDFKPLPVQPFNSPGTGGPTHPSFDDEAAEYQKSVIERNRKRDEHISEMEMQLKKSADMNRNNGTGIKAEPKLLEEILYRMQELITQNRILADNITSRLNAFYDSGENDPSHWEEPNVNNYSGFLQKMDHLNNMMLVNNELLMNIDEKLKRLI